MSSFRESLRKFGPGMLVTAAFIGPGTITTASTAGAKYGPSLLWAVLFAVFATVVLQEMAARLGLMSGMGLGEAIRTSIDLPLLRWLACGLIVLAIGFGNAAYQTGNVTGASMGLAELLGGPQRRWSMVVGLLAGALLLTGTYKVIERGLIALVIVMSLAFLVSAVLVRPPLQDVLAGLFIPRIPPGALVTVLALVGTTAVPYNLFLHASSVRQHWPDHVPRERALRESRIDTLLAVAIGGLITSAILTTAANTATAANDPGGLTSFVTMARQLEQTFGSFSKVLFATGLLAAGLTSAITAPLAAGYAVSGALGWDPDLRSWKFRSVSLLVLGAGTVLAATLQKSPAETILIAQVANGLLLPLIVVFLLFAVNQKKLMGNSANRLPANFLAFAVLACVAAMSAVKVAQLLRDAF